VTLPSSLQSLTFGHAFNQSLQGVTLPNSLQILTFGSNTGSNFYQDLNGVALPSSLRSLTFNRSFVRLEGMTFPTTLESFRCGGVLVSCAWFAPKEPLGQTHSQRKLLFSCAGCRFTRETGNHFRGKLNWMIFITWSTDIYIYYIYILYIYYAYTVYLL
jgi:hypothetical protein